MCKNHQHNIIKLLIFHEMIERNDNDKKWRMYWNKYLLDVHDQSSINITVFCFLPQSMSECVKINVV